MSLQKLSVQFPEPIQFPEGVDGQDLRRGWKRKI